MALEDFNGARILTSGGSGFIGRALCQRIKGLGGEVHVLARSEKPRWFEGDRWWSADVADRAEVAKAVSRASPDGVFHLAGPATGSPDPSLMEEMLSAHVLGTANVLEAAARLPKPPTVVTAGTMVEPGSEGQAFAASPYAAAKAAADHVARYFEAIGDLPVVRTRLFMVYGPGDRNLSKALPHLMACAVTGHSPRLGSGSLALDWTYIDDVVSGLLAAYSARPAERVDLGTGVLTTVRQVAEMIVAAGLLSEPPALGVREDRPSVEPVDADTRATADAIGWRAEVALKDGLDRSYGWYRDMLEARELIYEP